MRHFYLYILFYFILLQTLSAQDFNSSFYIDHTIDKNDSTKLFFAVENNNFFKNDEYFGSLTSGITYIGTYLQPKLVYYPYTKVKIQAGVHLLKYSGFDIFSQALPVFSFQYSPIKGIDFIMGSIYGGSNHGILEPMYSFENHLINNLENGIQILIHQDKFYADIWLNWEKFILKTSNSQESILGGIHSNYILFGERQKSNFKIDYQAIVAHKGGQFHRDDEILQTLVNMSYGLSYTKTINKSNWIQTVGIDNFFLSYNDVSPSPQLPYTMGYAVYSEMFVNSKYFSARAGYWTGEYYISSRGNPLFMTISDKNPDYIQSRTELITAKFALRKQLFKDITFEARFEPYMDLQQMQFEYSYSVYIIFNREFFLTKL